MKMKQSPQRQRRWWNRAIALSLSSLLGVAASATPSRAQEMFDETKGTTLFAFDEGSIPFTQNLKLEMRQPEKHPANPVLRRGKEGEPDNWAVQFYGSVIKIDGKYHMWYTAASRGKQEAATNQVAKDVSYWRVAYAESDDGVKWTKPKLGLVEYGGNKDNNLVAMDPQNVSILNVKVIHDPEDPDPSRRYKMTGHAYWTKEAPDGSRTLGTLVVFASPDGLKWKSLTPIKPKKNAFVRPEDVLLEDTHFEPSGGLYKWDGLYYISGQNAVSGARPYHGRVSRAYVSGDFVNWEKASNIQFVRTAQHELLGSGRSREGEQNHEGISVWNRSNMLMGVYGMWHGAAEWPGVTIDLGFVISNDGVNFREPMHEWQLITKGKDGEWDQGGVIQGQGFENVGDKTYIYYGSWDPRQWQSAPPRGGVGIVTVPRDRLGALTPDPTTVGGSVYKVQKLVCDLVTAPVKLKAGKPSKFFVNADGLGEQATLKVELLDASLKPLPGLSGDAAAVIKQSGFQTPVTFDGRADVENLPDRVRVRITYLGEKMKDIRFNALYVQ
jgi:hypothetical protein